MAKKKEIENQIKEYIFQLVDYKFEVYKEEIRRYTDALLNIATENARNIAVIQEKLKNLPSAKKEFITKKEYEKGFLVIKKYIDNKKM